MIELPLNSEHSSQRASRVANNVSSYGRDMVQNGVGFMHSVSLKSHVPVLLSMKLLPYPVNQSCFPSAYTETRFAKYSNIYEVKVISDRGSGVNKHTFTCVDNGETTVKRANGRSVAV